MAFCDTKMIQITIEFEVLFCIVFVSFFVSFYLLFSPQVVQKQYVI